MDGPRPPSRLDPWPAWTVITDAPLAGMAFAREAGAVLAWDQGEHLYLFDLAGERQVATRAPAKVVAAEISDDGSLVAALVAGGRLLLMSREFEVVADRPAVLDASAVAVDPHGRFVAVASRMSTTQFYSRFGRTAGRFATLQPIAHLGFVPDRPLLLAASAYGTILGLALTGSPSGLEAEELWKQQPMSNIGRLETSGDGGMVLASCYTHGVQRYDARGHNEGSYHLGGTAVHAVPDFAGRTIAVATAEGELALLNQGGNVRWKGALPRPALALEFDALGRFLIYGLDTGEITRLNLEGARRPDGASPREGLGASPRAGGVRAPAWTAPVAQSEAQAETAVAAVLDDPPRIGVMTSNKNRLQVFTATGGALGQGPETIGVGRFLRTCPGWIAAATDRTVVLYDARRNAAQKLDISLIEITHLAIRPDSYGVAIIQERDRIGRASLAGRWVWKRELRTPVEDLALGPDGLTAITTDDGQLLIFDPAGEPAGRFAADPAEPLCLVEAPEGAPAGVAWISLARRFQVLRGHRADGRPVWESPIPWEAWQLHRVGPRVVAVAPDGRAISYEGTGHPTSQTRSPASPGAFFPGPDGETWRVVRQGVHLICTDLPGHVHWRAVADEPLGPLAAGRTGVAALIGRALAWFPTPETP
jgi:hypothetical protein